MLGQGLDNGPHVADVHVFFEKVLQDFLQGRERQKLGSQVFHQLGRFFRQAIEQLLDFAASEQFRRMVYAPDDSGA